VTSLLEAELLAQIHAALLETGLYCEHPFWAKRAWRFDFAWPSHHLAVEVEGGAWSGGRHTRGAGFEADCEKYAVAALLGWRVLRVTGSMIKDGRALEIIQTAIHPYLGIPAFLEETISARKRKMLPKVPKLLPPDRLPRRVSRKTARPKGK
jgi:hypothetical protein